MLRYISIAVVCLSNIVLAAPTTAPFQASTNITTDAIAAHSNTTAPHASINPRQWGYGYEPPTCRLDPEPTELLNPTNVEKLGRYFLFDSPENPKMITVHGFQHFTTYRLDEEQNFQVCVSIKGKTKDVEIYPVDVGGAVLSIFNTCCWKREGDSCVPGVQETSVQPSGERVWVRVNSAKGEDCPS
ncbi:MAG: hypothetical protein Q9226_002607 [Calogaya cf. arnoldii]